MLYDIFNPYRNQIVTEYYVNIIKEAIVNNGNTISEITRLDKCKENRRKGIVVVSPLDVIKAKIYKYKTIIFWSQGLSAEESYMRNRSRVRYWVLKYITKNALKLATLKLFVSETMYKYYEKQFNLDLGNTFIMPCFNEEISKSNFNNDRYSNNYFLYAGGLDKWQCFRETALMYKKIEEIIPNTKFLVLVREEEKAKYILDEIGVKNYVIDFVPKDKLNKKIEKIKFGFCIREKNPVNYVSTPTKLSSYIANGIIPICSHAVKDFSAKAKNSKYCIITDNINIDQIVEMCRENVNSQDVYNDFINIFGNYYSRGLYIKELTKCMRNIL